MKILQINTVYAEGSTGMIAKAIHDTCAKEGIECLSAHRCVKKGQRPFADSIAISSKWDSRLHGWLARFTMFKGAGSWLRTARFLKKVRQYDPDLIHLHNLHGSYANLPLLMRYIKKHQIPVVWTLHDCWAFTSICPHFTIAGCDRWKTGCGNCPQRRKYSTAPLDLTRQVWKAKRAWFSGLPKAVLVTPSHWLEGLTKESFLGQYPTKTIYNGIDLNIFRPTPSGFRKRHGLQDKKIVMGVAFGWGYGKGLDVFIELRRRLADDYAIVLVGTDEEVDKQLSEGILSIHRTVNRRELAEIYTAADVFINPTREEVLGLVNLEALACGTPVVTFQSGGSPECIDDTCGTCVAIDDVDAMERQILHICQSRPYTQEACLRRASKFDKEQMLQQYLELYMSL